MITNLAMDETKKAQDNGDGKTVDLKTIRKEFTEAMKADMEERATKARAEIEAVLRKYRCAVMAFPKLEHLANGTFGVVAEAVIRALEPEA